MARRRQNAAGSDNTWLIVLVLAIVGYFLYKGVTTAATGAATSTAASPTAVPVGTPIGGSGIAFVGGDPSIDLATIEGQGVEIYSGDPTNAPLNSGGSGGGDHPPIGRPAFHVL